MRVEAGKLKRPQRVQMGDLLDETRVSEGKRQDGNDRAPIQV